MLDRVRRLPPARRLLVTAVALLAAVVGVGATATDPATASGLARWSGGVDLYRSGVFTTQQTWQWCTAADVQIIRNIVDHRADHSRSSQQRYFDAMRAHNRYDIPVADGVDPAGWTYGLRHFVDSRYRLVASRSFDAALRSAVMSLRRTNLPVGITVAHGNHAWVLTGFTATADPAATTHFTVTSVRVTGPLWGLQSRTYGYDMHPDTKLTPKQLAGFFTPWHYARIRMAWEGRWVSIQPIAATTAASAPVTTPRPTASATAHPSPTATPTASGGSIPAASPTPAVAPSADPAPGDVAIAGSGGSGASARADPESSQADAARPAGDTLVAWIAAGASIVLVVAIALGAGHRRRGGRPAGDR